MKFIKCSERLPPSGELVLWRLNEDSDYFHDTDGYLLGKLVNDCDGIFVNCFNKYVSSWQRLEHFESWVDLPEDAE